MHTHTHTPVGGLLGGRETGGFGLSASTLKIIACIIMAIDHVGAYILTDQRILRIIGSWIVKDTFPRVLCINSSLLSGSLPICSEEPKDAS